MKISNRGKFYKLCMAYVRCADVRSELFGFDSDCSELLDMLNNELFEYESEMLKLLTEDDEG